MKAICFLPKENMALFVSRCGRVVVATRQVARPSSRHLRHGRSTQPDDPQTTTGAPMPPMDSFWLARRCLFFSYDHRQRKKRRGRKRRAAKRSESAHASTPARWPIATGQREKKKKEGMVWFGLGWIFKKGRCARCAHGMRLTSPWSRAGSHRPRRRSCCTSRCHRRRRSKTTRARGRRKRRPRNATDTPRP